MTAPSLLAPPIAGRGWLTAICGVAALPVVWLAWRSEGAGVGVVTALWVLPAVWAACVDAFVSRLPDRLLAVGAAGLAVGVPLLAAGGDAVVVRALSGGALAGGVLLVVHLVSPTGMGFGDVKFAGLLGAGVGVVSVPTVVNGFAVAVLLQLLVLVVRLWPAQRSTGAARWAAPFGPALVAGMLAALAVEVVNG